MKMTIDLDEFDFDQNELMNQITLELSQNVTKYIDQMEEANRAHIDYFEKRIKTRMTEIMEEVADKYLSRLQTESRNIEMQLKLQLKQIERRLAQLEEESK